VQNLPQVNLFFRQGHNEPVFALLDKRLIGFDGKLDRLGKVKAGPS
jgi:hypothetical protein